MPIEQRMSAFGGKADIGWSASASRVLIRYETRRSDFAMTHKTAAH